MNERIRELATEAEFSEKDLHIQGDNFQKLADLIVRECINVIGESRESRQTAMYYRHRIAEHFGIL